MGMKLTYWLGIRPFLKYLVADFDTLVSFFLSSGLGLYSVLSDNNQHNCGDAESGNLKVSSESALVHFQ
jgi:hypothetical protein